MSKSSEAVKRWRANTKDRMVKSMGGKCQCCGYNICNNSLAFHHIDPSKKDLVFANTRANPQSWGAIVEELKKCILVCNNCHGEIHAGIRNIPEKYFEFDEFYSEYKVIKEVKQCSVKVQKKVDWDNIDLVKLLKTYTISEISDMLNVSDTTVYKRRNKLLEKMAQSIQASETPERIQYWKDKVAFAKKHLDELKRLNGIDSESNL